MNPKKEETGNERLKLVTGIVALLKSIADLIKACL